MTSVTHHFLEMGLFVLIFFFFFFFFFLVYEFPISPLFFLQVMTIIDIISNLSSNSKEPSKYPKVYMADPSNWRSCKLPVSICISTPKLLILTFSIMSFFFSWIFSSFLGGGSFYRKDFYVGFVFSNSFKVFLFEFAYCLKMVLF